MSRDLPVEYALINGVIVPVTAITNREIAGNLIEKELEISSEARAQLHIPNYYRATIKRFFTDNGQANDITPVISETFEYKSGVKVYNVKTMLFRTVGNFYHIVCERTCGQQKDEYHNDCSMSDCELSEIFGNQDPIVMPIEELFSSYNLEA